MTLTPIQRLVEVEAERDAFRPVRSRTTTPKSMRRACREAWERSAYNTPNAFEREKYEITFNTGWSAGIAWLRDALAAREDIKRPGVTLSPDEARLIYDALPPTCIGPKTESDRQVWIAMIKRLKAVLREAEHKPLSKLDQSRAERRAVWHPEPDASDGLDDERERRGR
jgi:hypothetical protein